ncbi:MAG TPA: hypothetical protein VGN34_06010, partial [Ktedonobacteraceae bacterium]
MLKTVKAIPVWKFKLLKKKGGEESKFTLFDYFVVAFFIFVLLITFIPLWYVVVVSFTPLELTKTSGYNLFLPPTQWSLAAYQQLLSQNEIVQSLINSVILTVSSVAVNMVLTTLTAYGLIYKNLPGRNLLLTLFLFTFLFNAGLIPTYLV